MAKPTKESNSTNYDYRLTPPFMEALEAKSVNYRIDECIVGSNDINEMKKVVRKLKEAEEHLKRTNDQLRTSKNKIIAENTKMLLEQISLDTEDRLAKSVVSRAKIQDQINQTQFCMKLYKTPLYSTHKMTKDGGEIFQRLNDFPKKEQEEAKSRRKIFTEVEAFLKSENQTRRKCDSALNLCLLQMSMALGGIPKLFRSLKHDRALSPRHLGDGFTIDSLRKRVERFKKNHPNSG